MFNELSKIALLPPKKRSSKLFVESVVTFNQSLFSGEQPHLIERILEVYLILPGINSAALFALNEETFEFHLSNFVSTSDDTTANNEKFLQKIFDKTIEKGTVALALEKGQIVREKLDEYHNADLIPVISPIGILGMILLTSEKKSKEYSSSIRNYCVLHANQMAYLLFNSKLNKKIYNLEAELEQKISVRIEKIKQSSRELQLILDSILTGVFIIDKKTNKIIDANYAAIKLIGVTKDEVIGTTRDQWHFDKKNYSPNLNQYNEEFTEEAVLIDRNKNKIPILRTFSNLLIGNKDIYLESFIDITERKRNEEEIKLQTNLLKGAAEASNSLLTKSNFNEAVNKAIEFLGRAANVDRVYIYENKFDEASNQPHSVIKYFWANKNAIPLKRLSKHFYFGENFKEWKEISETKGAWRTLTKNLSGEVNQTLASLETKSILIVPITVENQFWGFIGFDDCTNEREWTDAEESILKVTATSIGGAIHRYKSKLQLIEAKEKADRSDNLKSEFLAQISHEIRTPINAILSFTSILKEEFEDKLTEDLQTTFEVIVNAGNRITRTVELILNMSEIQTGIYEYNPVKINFCDEVISPLYNQFLRYAKTKNIELRISKNCNDTIIKADKYSVIQIFSNLIDNAVKFTEKGTVSININRNDRGEFIVEVCDTGIGISNDYINEIYSVFSQEDHGYTRKYEGNGLGLALVKKYCDMNNFDLKIESQKEVGSKFIVVVPAK